MNLRAFCASVCFICSVPAFATAVVPSAQVTYTVNLTGTKNGNDVTDVILAERVGDLLHLTAVGNMAATGITVYQSPWIGQTAAAIVGLDAPVPGIVPTAEGDAEKWHLIFAINRAAAVAAQGNVISVLYPPAHENPAIDAIRAWREAGDTSAIVPIQAFLGNAALSAMFSVPGPFTVVEFSVGVPVGTGGASGTPEPATFALAGIGVVAIWAIRRRVRS